MPVADLYIRVSTDEQAYKGYSQRNQDEILHQYCALHGVSVRKVVYEDHSAKTFNRPAWSAMMDSYKKAKQNTMPNLLLFTKWDRFSRNAADAYQMIGLLRRYGIEPQAIEQPLDLSVPENKMMLAFYLAAPEVENDRRALNVFHGMRRARKEGRWMASAPTGYANRTAENGRKYIAPKEPAAGIMKWAFAQIAKGKYPVEQVWRVCAEKGLKTGYKNFHYLIRNPVYCGKIIVPAYRDEPLYWAEGQHEPIITEKLFHRVQRVLKGRINRAMKITSPRQLPLRGFLKCPRCERMLTGSASRGRSAYYHYYHCSSPCGVRFRAEQVNRAFDEGLGKLRLRPNVTRLFERIIRDVWDKRTAADRHRHAVASRELEQQEQRAHRVLDLMLAGELDPNDYTQAKAEAERKITELRRILSHLPAVDVPFKSSRNNSLPNLCKLYERASVEEKRKLVACFYPKGLLFDVNYIGGQVFEIVLSIA